FLEQREEKKREEIIARKTEFESRTASLESLPIVSFGNQKGILVGQNVLTIAWQLPLPESIILHDQELFLLSKNAVLNGPALYGPKNSSGLEISALPQVGSYDLQLVTFGKTIEVFLSEYQDGSVDVLSGFPTANGFVLYQTGSQWLPVGFYESQGRSFVPLQSIPTLTDVVSSAPTPQPTLVRGDQKYYVLQNDYTQFVFSNIGGALSEINLPFYTDKNPYSVVNEIDADREIAEDSPQNNRFPAHPYYTYDSQNEHEEGSIGGYYPLLRRSLAGKNLTTLSPEYYGLNLISEYPEMAELNYTVQSFKENQITFVANQPHRKITKTYTIAPGHEGAPYCLDLELKVEGDSRGLWLTSGVTDVEIMSKASTPRIQYRLTRKGKSEVEKLTLPKAKEIVVVSSVYPEWVVTSNGYLGMILDPLKEIGPGFKVRTISGTEAPTRLSLINPHYQPYPAQKYPGYQVLLPIPSTGGSFKFRIYSGPFEEETLKAVDKIYANPSAGYTPDYIACRTFYGWFSFISKPFAKLLFIVMSFFHTLTGSWGLSIILLTLFLRLVLYPLNAWSFKSMRRMQKLSPQIKAIQAKHKKDPKKAQMEIMALYREKKVNPFMGCFPILIQLPFLIAMFDLLKSSFQLRGATFITGWIENLTAPDVLFSWKTPLFFIGNQFHLLPFLLGAVMFVQQRLTAAMNKKSSELTDQERQQRAMGTIMTVVFTVMFYHFPSGLNIYWLSSMLLGIIQQWFTNKMLDKKEKEVELIDPRKKTKK
ncbi:MAG: membrane protein insertase YidC, partial [Chlamydiales bacterium]